jgi:hypothetical protein
VVIVAVVLMGCAMGDIFNGGTPYDLSDQEVIGSWQAAGAGTFTFEAGGAMSAKDLPAKAFGPDTDRPERVAGKGTWRITYPHEGTQDQRNIVELRFDEVDGHHAAYFTRMSATKPESVIFLTLDVSYDSYTKA